MSVEFNSIKGYFYKNNDLLNYNFVITEINNNTISIESQNNVQVLINFTPEHYIDYEFEIIEANDDYLSLINNGNNYQINFVQNTSELNTSECLEMYDYNREYENIKEEDMDCECNIDDDDDALFCLSDSNSENCENNECDYDSEGYYFRPTNRI